MISQNFTFLDPFLDPFLSLYCSYIFFEAPADPADPADPGGLGQEAAGTQLSRPRPENRRWGPGALGDLLVTCPAGFGWLKDLGEKRRIPRWCTFDGKSGEQNGVLLISKVMGVPHASHG